MWLILLIVLSSIFIGCGKSNKLYIYNWTDYLSPDVICLFEEKYDCDVIVDAFDSNEMMYAKIMNTKDSCEYDIIFPSSYETKMLKDKHLLEELDHSKIPNFFNNYDIRYDNIILDEKSSSNTYPKNIVLNNSSTLEHEATISKINEEKLFYLKSLGISEDNAKDLYVLGFMSDFKTASKIKRPKPGY